MIQYVVQPVIVVDDGEHLTPIKVDPVTVPAAEWEAFVATGLAESLDQLQAQISGPPTEDD